MNDSYIALDIETTGLSPEKDTIIEIGALKIQGDKVVGQYSKLINPGRIIPDRITALTGIHNSMVGRSQSFEEIADELLDFLGDEVLLGHNILFDYSFLKTHFSRCGRSFQRNGIDTLTLSKFFHKELASKSLENMCTYYGIVNEQAHRACSDAEAAARLYMKIKNRFLHENSHAFKEKALIYKQKKEGPITIPQKNYLLDLIKYHKIDFAQTINDLSKSEASKMIDKIIMENGKIH